MISTVEPTRGAALHSSQAEPWLAPLIEERQARLTGANLVSEAWRATPRVDPYHWPAGRAVDGGRVSGGLFLSPAGQSGGTLTIVRPGRPADAGKPQLCGPPP